MASIAYHALHGVIHRLTAAGISVAVAEQVADGKRAVAERYPADPYGGESPMADAPTPASSPTFDRARAGDDAAFDFFDRMKRARYGDPPPVGRGGRHGPRRQSPPVHHRLVRQGSRTLLRQRISTRHWNSSSRRTRASTCRS